MLMYVDLNSNTDMEKRTCPCTCDISLIMARHNCICLEAPLASDAEETRRASSNISVCFRNKPGCYSTANETTCNNPLPKSPSYLCRNLHENNSGSDTVSGIQPSE